MQGIHDLIDSERGWFSLLLLAIVTVLLVIAKITPEQWLDYTKWLVGFLVGSKTLTTAVEIARRPPADPATPAPAPTADPAKPPTG